MTKMTYVDALEIAIEHLGSPEAVERLTALRDTLVKRAETPRKPSAKAIEARNFRETIEDWNFSQGLHVLYGKGNRAGVWCNHSARDRRLDRACQTGRVCQG